MTINWGRPHWHTADKFGTIDEPWMSRHAVEYMRNNLKEDMVVLEYGAGSSTAWIAQRVKKLYSIESDKTWFDNVTQDLKEKNVTNVEMILRPFDEFKDCQNEELKVAYLSAIDEIKEDFDFIIIDGRLRNKATKKAVERLKTPGTILFDDTNRLFSNDGKPWYKPAVDFLNTFGWERQDYSNGETIVSIWIKR